MEIEGWPDAPLPRPATGPWADRNRGSPAPFDRLKCLLGGRSVLAGRATPSLGHLGARESRPATEVPPSELRRKNCSMQMRRPMRPQINGEGRIGIEPWACLRSGSVNSKSSLLHHHKVLQLRDTVTEGNPENPALSSSPSDRRRLFDEAALPTEFLQRLI